MSQEKILPLQPDNIDAFGHLITEKKTLTSPKDWKLKLVSLQNEEDTNKLEYLIKENGISTDSISTKPFESGRDELINLTPKFYVLPQNEEGLMRYIVEGIKSLGFGFSESDLSKTIGHGPIIHDLCYLTRSVGHYAQNPNLIESNARWIWDPLSKRLDLYIGPEEHRLLNKTRLLGLIPFETIDRLKDLKITILGSSVAASTADLLVSLGAENMTFYDSGYLDPAVNQRMPGGMGNFQNCGEPKVKALLQLVQGRNPYGKYSAVPGRVLLPWEQPQSEHDTPINEAIKDAGLVIEAVDNAATKLGVRSFMQECYPDVPLLYIADLGSDPVAGIEIPGRNNWFNQNLDISEQRRMFQSKTPQEAARSIYLMVNNDLNNDHRLQFLLSCLGVVPYWSQSPISSRESASLAVKLVSSILSGNDISGKNYHSENSPKTLADEFSEEQSLILKTLISQLLDIK